MRRGFASGRESVGTGRRVRADQVTVVIEMVNGRRLEVLRRDAHPRLLEGVAGEARVADAVCVHGLAERIDALSLLHVVEIVAVRVEDRLVSDELLQPVLAELCDALLLLLLIGGDVRRRGLAAGSALNAAGERKEASPQQLSACAAIIARRRSSQHRERGVRESVHGMTVAGAVGTPFGWQVVSLEIEVRRGTATAVSPSFGVPP